MSIEATREAAERVLEVIRRHRSDAVVVGAMALAAHKYPRETEDFDLGIAVSPGALAALADELRAQGWEVELRAPDAQDPLGGVIDIRAPGADLIQIVNFDNSPAGGFPAAIRDGIRLSSLLVEGGSLRVVDLHTLIALKLYSGGSKSKLDVLELLERNQPVDLDALRARCESYGLSKKLERLLSMARESDAS